MMFSRHWVSDSEGQWYLRNEKQISPTLPFPQLMTLSPPGHRDEEQRNRIGSLSRLFAEVTI